MVSLPKGDRVEPHPPATKPPSRPRPTRPPNREHRRHLRARLDALYFHLYGLDRDDVAYILSTFPIIQRQNQAAFNRYRTKALILAYMNALAAGDTDTRMAL